MICTESKKNINIKPKNKLSDRRRKDLITGLVFASPVILGFIIFVVGPMIASGYFSLTDYSIASTPKWVGFDNYKNLLTGGDPFFYKSLIVTTIFVIFSVPIQLIFSLMIAMLLNNDVKFKGVFRTIFYLPTIVPAAASSMIWIWLMDPDLGLFNTILRSLGMPTSKWIFDEKTVLPSLIIMSLWTTGSTVIIFLAGLQGVPKQLYEAVEIDGGNSIHKFINVTVPMITPTLFFNLVMGFINGFQTFTVLCLLPFYWMIRSSLMDMSQIFAMPPIWIPNPIKFSNYKEALNMIPFLQYFFNTAFIVVLAVAGTVITSSLCAYSFSRINWIGRDKVFGILLTAMMIPFAVTLIPTFIGWQKLGMVNTYAPLIVPAWFGGGVFNVFLLRQFFMTIPKELDESVMVDGGNHFTIYSKIIIPLSKPSLIVVGLFAFMGAWNDFLGHLVYLNDSDKFTLSLGLMQFQGMYTAQWQYMMAASAVVIIPSIIIFFLGQDYFIEGIAMTGMKG